MAHVNGTGRVRKHLQQIVLGQLRVLRHPEALILFPEFLPLVLDNFRLVSFFHGSNCAYLKDMVRLRFDSTCRRHLIQHAVDKSRRVLRTKTLADLNGLVDTDIERNIRTEE